MNLPRIEIFLDEKSNLCLTKVERANADPKVILELELEELLREQPAEAAHRLGGTVLNILRLWNRDKFGNWEVPPPKQARS